MIVPLCLCAPPRHQPYVNYVTPSRSAVKSLPIHPQGEYRFKGIHGIPGSADGVYKSEDNFVWSIPKFSTSSGDGGEAGSYHITNWLGDNPSLADTGRSHCQTASMTTRVGASLNKIVFQVSITIRDRCLVII